MRSCSVITHFRATSCDTSPGSGQSTSCSCWNRKIRMTCVGAQGGSCSGEACWSLLFAEIYPCSSDPLQLSGWSTCLLVLSDGFCLSGHSHHSRNLPSCQHNSAENCLPQNDTEDTESCPFSGLGAAGNTDVFRRGLGGYPQSPAGSNWASNTLLRLCGLHIAPRDKRCSCDKLWAQMMFVFIL